MVQLVPEPLPASSTGSRDQELDVTLDETSRPEAEHVQNDTEREAGSSEQETSAEGEEKEKCFKYISELSESLQIFVSILFNSKRLIITVPNFSKLFKSLKLFLTCSGASEARSQTRSEETPGSDQEPEGRVGQRQQPRVRFPDGSDPRAGHEHRIRIFTE